jgi:hypothetical protein
MRPVVFLRNARGGAVASIMNVYPAVDLASR